MSLSDFIRTHEREIVDAWVETVKDRFDTHHVSEPLLVDELPDFLREIAVCLALPMPVQADYQGAKSHGRQRLSLGVDIAALVQEFGMVGQTILHLAQQHGVKLAPEDAWRLSRMVFDGAAQAAGAYGELRDRQIEQQAAEHFSFMAHEIRTPLQTARLAASLLKQTDERNAEHLRRLERAHARLAELVDNALLSARLYGRPRLHISQVDLRQLAQEVMDEIKPQADNRKLALELDVEDVQIDVDYKLAYAALINLMGNAVKFSRPGGTIRLALSCNDRMATFEVEDACGGLPEKLRDQLFDLFVQGSGDRSGFGIGLMIVQRAAAAHGGSVTVQNRPGKGCRFCFRLPRTQGEQRSDQPS